MGDIFLHVLFARRLRHATALHPVAAEALARRPSMVAYGAALPLLPGLERSRVSFFKRIFGIGAGESQKWTRALEPNGSRLSELAAAICDTSTGDAVGPLPKLALTIGVLSHEVLSQAIGPTLASIDPAARPAYARGQARLWMQFAVPTRRELVAEWSAARAVQDPEVMKRAFDLLDAAFRASLKESPGKEVFTRWARGLAHAVLPLVDGTGMPDALGLNDHDVRASVFDGGAAFIERTEAATTRLAFLVGRLASVFEGRSPTYVEVRDALFDSAGVLREAPSTSELDGLVTRWSSRMGELREEALTRGRNPKAAYHDDGHPQMPPLPEDSGESPAFRAPAHTQEISAAEIEGQLGDSSSEPSGSPLKTQEISAVEIEEATSLPPQPPRVTQQISLADIAEEMSAADDGRPGSSNPFDAPSSTQQVSLDDIEAELSSAMSTETPRPPAVTQQISAADIEAELASSSTTPPPPPDEASKDNGVDHVATAAPAAAVKAPPPPPAATQQISAADIEAELEARADKSTDVVKEAVKNDGTPERPAD
jgi:hypothetical protein